MTLYISCLPLPMNKNPSCPKCKCAEVVKNGKINEKQMVKCKKCSFQFTRLTPRGYADSEKSFAVVLYNLELSMNAIVNYEKPVPKDAIIVELDEMWHYLGSKKNSSGYGKLIAEKLENSSIGNAVAVIKRHS